VRYSIKSLKHSKREFEETVSESCGSISRPLTVLRGTTPPPPRRIAISRDRSNSGRGKVVQLKRTTNRSSVDRAVQRRDFSSPAAGGPEPHPIFMGFACGAAFS
jgi:hypothetical protein